jgi:acetyl-CoA acyltransferase 1
MLTLRIPSARPTPVFGSASVLADPPAVDCAKPMGWTSEMLALEYSVSREKQDEYGLLSHNRASAAQKAGHFDGQILPIKTSVLSDPKNPESDREEITVDKDDGIRHGLTLEKISTAKPAFPKFGESRSTGPNSSQVTDGAAMVLMMPRWKAEELGLEVLAKHVTTSVVGVEPRIMGVGPVYAIP